MAGRKEILYDGYFYDVTDFIKSHPGGTIIEYYTEKGEDSTHAIQQFHKRSIKKVNNMMRSLKKRPASDNEIGLDPVTLKRNRMLTNDFTNLYLELEAEGYFEPSYLHACIQIMEVFLYAAIGYASLQSQNYFVAGFGVLFIMLARIRTGFLQHELGHYSFSGYPNIDRVIHSIIYGLVIGNSSSRWKRNHNRHHAMPQRLQHDVDLETMPLLAYNKNVVRNSKDGKTFWIQYQAYLFVFNVLLVGLLWQMWKDPKFVYKRKCYLDFIAITVHMIIVYQIGFLPWLFSTWFGLIYFLTSFTMNHTFLPVTAEPTHWVEYSLLHTADVEHSVWYDWLTGYLNCQIEHHLFPTMPNYRLPLIKSRVKALAEKHNIPYICHTYPEALRKVFINMLDVSKEVKNL